MKIVKSTHPNIITVLSSSVESTAKLPLKISRGSEKQRYKLADCYSKKLEEGLDKVSYGKRCLVSDFMDLINEIISPAKINIKISKLTDKWDFGIYRGGSISTATDYINNAYKIGDVVIESTHKSVNGYCINLPLNKDCTIINNKYSAFHEARHLFDYICNPKTIDSKTLKIIDNEEKTNAYMGIYKTFVSDINLFGGIKNKVSEDMKKLSDDEAIDCLQNVRRTLKTEINAYNDADEYMRKSPLENFLMIEGSHEFQLFHNYPKRLKLVNQMLSERLKSARENIKKSLSD